MHQYELNKDQLSLELTERLPSARSLWDVTDLFPIIFVDFDNERVSAFYSAGTPMEKHLPDGWSSKFEDFASDSPPDIFPKSEKFWVKGEIDLLQLLNDRGKENSTDS